MLFWKETVLIVLKVFVKLIGKSFQLYIEYIRVSSKIGSCYIFANFFAHCKSFNKSDQMLILPGKIPLTVVSNGHFHMHLYNLSVTSQNQIKIRPNFEIHESKIYLVDW